MSGVKRADDNSENKFFTVLLTISEVVLTLDRIVAIDDKSDFEVNWFLIKFAAVSREEPSVDIKSMVSYIESSVISNPKALVASSSRWWAS